MDRIDELHINLSGVSLQSFSIDEKILRIHLLKRITTFDEISTIRLSCWWDVTTRIEPDDSNAESYMRLICITFEGLDSALVTVVLLRRHWRRVYYVSYWAPELPIAKKKRGCSEHLTYLRIDDAPLPGVLSTDVAFVALRRLRIDVTFTDYDTRRPLLWPPDRPWDPDFNIWSGPAFRHESIYHLPCAVLEQHGLVATQEMWDYRVVPSQVAFLGRALGQLERSQEKNA